VLSLLAVAGCRGSSGNAVIDASHKQPKTTGMSGRIVAINGVVITVTGRVLAGEEGKPTGPAVTRRVKVFPQAIGGMQVGDQVDLLTTPEGAIANDKARDARNEAQKVLTDTSTCSEWKQASGGEQVAYVKKFLTGQGEQPPVPAHEIAADAWIAGQCAEGSQSQIGALAAEGLTK